MHAYFNRFIYLAVQLIVQLGLHAMDMADII